MLSITRRSGEEIVVIDKETGEHMTIIVRIQKNQVRFGMQASQRFQILRKEVHERQERQLVAATPSATMGHNASHERSLPDL